MNAERVEFEDLTKRGAEKVKVKYLIGEEHGSRRFLLRYYKVEKGGHTPLDQHVYEHQVFVLNGNGIVKRGTSEGMVEHELKHGDALFIASNEVHQFANVEEAPFVFLCVRGVEGIYGRVEVPSAQQTAC